METMEPPANSTQGWPEQRAWPGAPRNPPQSAERAQPTEWFDDGPSWRAADVAVRPPAAEAPAGVAGGPDAALTADAVDTVDIMDIVDIAGEDSFPASDPPAWNAGRDPGAWA